MTDSRNWTVALKARVDNCEQMESAIFELTESLGLVTSQEDIYFDVPHGQLKLRIVHPNEAKISNSTRAAGYFITVVVLWRFITEFTILHRALQANSSKEECLPFLLDQ
uniref:CYTH domain-containing protein n=1 Tax=Ascaris lumbricoides TaxID=6252 RepID=A0A0M3ITX2_ASCLU